MVKIPFLDLKSQHAPIREQLDAAIAAVIDSNAFAGGRFVEMFEREFASYCGSDYAAGVGTGTDALWLTLLALGVAGGDEVITTPSTFIATAEAITFCGARPVFVDIEERTYTLNPRLLEAAITPRTRAIIPVHLFGQTAAMNPILQIASEYGIPVVEDACQAHGASYRGTKAGTMGIAGCFSFYPGKNLGAFGEAGAVISNDADLIARIKVLRDHGQARKYYHSQIGWNARMDGIQGAVLSVKLKYLEAGNSKRRAHAAQYDVLLENLEEVITPEEAPPNHHVYHVYAIRVGDRDRIRQSMAEQGVDCAIHYPVPLHLQDAYHSLGYGRGAFPVAERCAEQFLSLPMYPELSREQVERVTKALKVGIEATLQHECAT